MVIRGHSFTAPSFTDAELDMLEEYLAEMATPAPTNYTFTEAELDTILEWRTRAGRHE